MLQKKHKPEEIVAKFRQVDVLVSQGRSVAESHFNRQRSLSSLANSKAARAAALAAALIEWRGLFAA